MSAIVFLDTETTGLSLDDDIWEFAAIRRETDGTESEHHLFIEHDMNKCVRLPQSFLDDHRKRWVNFERAERVSRGAAAEYIAGLFEDRPHIVGAVPNFDTERLAILLRRHGFEPGWHYHLIDVENLAVGYIAGGTAGQGHDPIPLPWNSDDVSRAVGVEPPGEGVRHTAMGDVRWCKAIYDAVVGS